MINLKELIEVADHSAETIFLDVGKVLPMYHAITAEDKHMIMPMLGTDKDKAVEIAKAAFAKYNVVQYVFIDEAWILDTVRRRLPKGDEWRKIKSEGLRDHPDRREILMYSAESRKGEQFMGHRYILRPEHGPPKLSPLTIRETSGDYSTGRMVGLLKK
jgi:hypothetical protein